MEDVTVGALFIGKYDNTLIRVENVSGGIVLYRYIVTWSLAHLGKKDWMFLKGLLTGWERVD